jgi:hypothetical protein
MYNTLDYFFCGGGGDLPIVRYSKEHNVSKTDLFLSSGDGGNTYSFVSVRKS